MVRRQPGLGLNSLGGRQDLRHTSSSIGCKGLANCLDPGERAGDTPWIWVLSGADFGDGERRKYVGKGEKKRER